MEHKGKVLYFNSLMLLVPIFETNITDPTMTVIIKIAPPDIALHIVHVLVKLTKL